MSLTASTRAPTEAQPRRAGASPSEDVIRYCSSSGDILGRIEDELEADGLFEEDARPSMKLDRAEQSPSSSQGMLARSAEGSLDFDLARGGFMEAAAPNFDLFDLNVEIEHQEPDACFRIAFDDMDKPSSFGVNRVGMRKISFDTLPAMQDPVAAEVDSDVLPATGKATPPPVAPPRRPPGERPQVGFRRMLRHAAPPTAPPAQPTSGSGGGDAAVSTTRPEAHSEASMDIMAGAAGAALMRYRRMGRN